MIFKNTFKLLISNFSLTYKVFIYKLIIIILSLGVAGTVGTPFLIYLSDINFFGGISSLITYLFENINLGNVFITFKNVFINIIEVFNTIDKTLLINAVFSILVFICIYGLLGDLCELASIDSINANLSSKTKISFFKSLVGKSFKSLCKTIIKFFLSIIYFIILGFIVYFGFTSYDLYSGIAKILIPMLMFLSFVLVSALHLSLICGFSPSIIINDNGIFKALKTSFSVIMKKYFRLLSTSIMLVFVLVVGNLLIAVYSFFAGLIISLPITYVVLCLFKTIAYYECNGMRYYVGETIRTPLKKDELDKISKMKYIF